MSKILSIFGTRPEAIKMAPLVKELERRSGVKSIVCVTAQHRFMLDQVLEAFGIKPDFDLDIMRHGQSLSALTSSALCSLEPIIRHLQPDLVLVHGDTTTALAGALAAYYNRVAIGHVEAGLRTGDKFSPFPEEANRRMIDAMADMLFAPTEFSRENLLRENIAEDKIHVTGNTAIDALATTVRQDFHHSALDWVAKGEKLLLLTAHRRENLGEPLRSIFGAVRRIVDEFEDVKLIYPMHLNPLVRSAAQAAFADCERIRLIEPLDVFDFHNFQSRAHIILTDSGGIQEEAPSLGKPVLVLRDTTERPEGVKAGTLKLVGTKEERVYSEIKRLLTDEREYLLMSRASNPYGDGHASERIADAIVSKYP